MGFAEFIIGPAEGRTRWLYPSYKLIVPDGQTAHARHARFARRVDLPQGAALAYSENRKHSPGHPASLAEGRIAVVTRREVGMRWT
jgi:hypothetical protein